MFRRHTVLPATPISPLSRETLRPLAAELLAPGQFYLARGFDLRLDYQAAEEIPWELFQGRLLDVTQTRQRQLFESWNLYLIEEGVAATEPLLALKLDASSRKLYVVRALRCHVWEGYDSGGGVFLSREALRWVRELVETIDLAQWQDTATLADELIAALYHAVVGASRLPLTSIESPLPGYALGQLGYVYQPSAPAQPYREGLSLLAAVAELPLHPGERARLLQLLLQTTPAQPLATALVDSPLLAGQSLLDLLRRMVNEVSLSPWTDLVPRTLAFLDATTLPLSERIDFLADWLLQLGRHLTAYDLTTFHHRGANYPDALALDLLLKRYLRHVSEQPERFDTRKRRRALRQAWFLRRFYDGHPVPEVPTSPGENQRFYAGIPRVPEEQFQHFARRPRKLYAGDPLTPPALLAQAFADLEQPTELRELGLALFVDRPLGAGKRPGEPDQTILLAQLAFSRSLARQRLRYLHQPMGLLSAARLETLLNLLAELSVPGIPLEQLGGTPRPGSVSVLDARQVADDFVFVRTLPNSVQELYQQYDFSALPGGLIPWLVVPVSPPGAPLRLHLYDADFQLGAQLTARSGGGFVRARGVEYLAEGFDVTQLGDTQLVPPMRVPPRVHQSS